MEASVKHRIIGSALVIAIALVISPLFLKEKKPAWIVKEDKQSFMVPAAPMPIKVVLEKPKKEWVMPIEAIKIITDNNVENKVKMAELAFSDQQLSLASKTEHAIINEEVAKLAQITNKKIKGRKSIIAKKSAHSLKKPYYSLQLATFSSNERAKRLLAHLKKDGIDAFLSQRTSKNGTLFTMVMAGRLENKSDIKHLQQKLNDSINVNSLIIKHS